MFFESLAEWSVCFTNVCVAAVIVICDVVDRLALVFFSSNVLVHYHRMEGVGQYTVHILRSKVSFFQNKQILEP